MTSRHALRTLLLFALTATGCSGCEGPVQVEGIGPEGGTLIDESCGLRIDFPAGALAEKTLFVVSTSTSEAPAVDGRVTVSKVCAVDPPMLLEKPTTVILSFDPTRIPKRSRAIDVDARVNPAGTAQARLQGNVVDEAGSRVKAQTLGTGRFFATVPVGARIAAIEVKPETPGLLPGQTVQFSATVRDELGNEVPEAQVSWSASLARVGSIDSSGLFTAKAAGRTPVSATVGDVVGGTTAYVLSARPSPSGMGWENPWPQGDDVKGLDLLGDGRLVIGADHGGAFMQETDGGFRQLLSAFGVETAGIAVGGGQIALAGTLDVVRQGTEQVAGFTFALGPSPALATPAPSSLLPRAIHGTATDLLAVGSGNDAWYLGPGDGGWRPITTPVSEALLAVDRDPVEGRRVVSARGQVYRLSDDWFPLWDQPLGSLFSRATLVGGEPWASDEASVLRRFVEGTGWQSEPAPPAPSLDHIGLLGAMPSRVVVGLMDRAGAPHLFSRVRDQTNWTEYQGHAGIDEFLAFKGTGGETGWVGGAHGALWQLQGGLLRSLRTGPTDDITAISVLPSGEAFAVTSACADFRCSRKVGHLLVRGRNQRWSTVPGFESTPLSAIAARSAGDVYFGGEGSRLFRYDGSSVQPLTTDGNGDVRGMKVCGADVWAVGSNGFAAKFDGATRFKVDSPGSNGLRAIACTDANDIWIAGDYVTFRRGQNAWTRVTTDDFNQSAWRAIWVDGQDVFLAGEATYLLHLDRVSNAWEVMDQPAGLRLRGAYGLWAGESGELYLAGVQQRPRAGLLLRYDGAQWTALDPGTDQPLSAIDGTAPGTFLVAGAGGALLHSNPPPAP